MIIWHVGDSAEFVVKDDPYKQLPFQNKPWRHFWLVDAGALVPDLLHGIRKIQNTTGWGHN